MQGKTYGHVFEEDMNHDAVPYIPGMSVMSLDMSLKTGLLERLEDMPLKDISNQAQE